MRPTARARRRAGRRAGTTHKPLRRGMNASLGTCSSRTDGCASPGAAGPAGQTLRLRRDGRRAGSVRAPRHTAGRPCRRRTQGSRRGTEASGAAACAARAPRLSSTGAYEAMLGHVDDCGPVLRATGQSSRVEFVAMADPADDCLGAARRLRRRDHAVRPPRAPDAVPLRGKERVAQVAAPPHVGGLRVRRQPRWSSGVGRGKPPVGPLRRSGTDLRGRRRR
jgi:hypothetical protein